MTDSSILDGMDNVINEAFGLEKERIKYESKKRCQMFSKGKEPEFDGQALVQKILAKIESNWHQGKSRSTENWRWGPKRGELKTKSEEVILERWIVRTMGNDWMNQVPVASGLTASRSAGGRRAIDLVHRCGDRWYEFIELKVNDGAGAPLYAAMEILQYGVLYIFSRKHAATLGYKETDMLGAPGIHLKVLAPANYYEGYHLSWLEDGINSGLANFLDEGDRGFKMNFKFEFLSRSPVTWKARA